jgi:hypothetical protein
MMKGYRLQASDFRRNNRRIESLANEERPQTSGFRLKAKATEENGEALAVPEA